MMKTIKDLVDSAKSLTIGNHSVTSLSGDRCFYYYRTCICRVNERRRQFFIADGGYKTTSTSRAIADYINHFKTELGYKLIDTRSKYDNGNRCIALDNALDFNQYLHYAKKEGLL